MGSDISVSQLGPGSRGPVLAGRRPEQAQPFGDSNAVSGFQPAASSMYDDDATAAEWKTSRKFFDLIE
ncbi:hypothetical protein E4U43_001988 [Claviceps pusilla]|uniref:Uncharacterized protein n=1 Tax=Claviceps pusilla TaxID=123648 RepID=A0A9P7N6V8_9HYPO|nr:hypothetical protein E4U43_001988 [Claviceps pusilla]